MLSCSYAPMLLCSYALMLFGSYDAVLLYVRVLCSYAAYALLILWSCALTLMLVCVYALMLMLLWFYTLMPMLLCFELLCSYALMRLRSFALMLMLLCCCDPRLLCSCALVLCVVLCYATLRSYARFLLVSLLRVLSGLWQTGQTVRLAAQCSPGMSRKQTVRGASALICAQTLELLAGSEGMHGFFAAFGGAPAARSVRYV